MDRPAEAGSPRRDDTRSVPDSRTSAGAAGGRRIFRGATLVTMDPADRVREGDLVVRDGHFESVGGRLADPAAEVVDLGGRWIIPGVVTFRKRYLVTGCHGRLIFGKMQPDL